MKSLKFDEGKLPIDKLFHQFPNALQGVIETSTYGHNKYLETDEDWLSFKRLDNAKERYKGALMRHLFAYLNPLQVNIDSESGLHHLKHAAWNCLALLQLIYEDEQNY